MFSLLSRNCRSLPKTLKSEVRVISFSTVRPIIGAPVSSYNFPVCCYYSTRTARKFITTTAIKDKMAEKKILLIGPIAHAHSEFETLSDVGELLMIESGTRESLIKDFQSGKFDGVVAIWWTFASSAWTGDFDEELINALPASVKSVSLNRAGYDQVNVEAANKRGLLISNTPGAVDDATADVAMYLMLGAFRRSWIPELAIREGRWKGKTALGHDPQDKLLGIVGMGGIGKALAKRCLAFDMKIQYHNRNRLDPEPPNTKWVSMEELIKTSDVISLHTPLTPQTHHLINKEQFAQMKDGVIIVNTARGPVVNEQALVDALESGKVFSAGLDVFENEPQVHEGLLKNENVVMYPHIGTATYETQFKMEKLVIANLRSSVTTGKLVTGIAEQKHL